LAQGAVFEELLAKRMDELRSQYDDDSNALR
jgi:hypothetical protein